MKIIHSLILALAVCTGLTVTSCSDSDRTYERTINPDTLTWEEIDPGVRKYFIKTIIIGLENSAQIINATDSFAIVADILERTLDADSSDLSGEYASYFEEMRPITKAFIADMRKAERIPLPSNLDDVSDYQQRVMRTALDIHAKHETEIAEINRRHPNAAALFDTPQPGIQAQLIGNLFNAKYNLEEITIKHTLNSGSYEEGIRKTIEELKAIAEAQK